MNLVRKGPPRDEQTVVSSVTFSIPEAPSRAGYNGHAESLRGVGPFRTGLPEIHTLRAPTTYPFWSLPNEQTLPSDRGPV
jgi:hypothetical protein